MRSETSGRAGLYIRLSKEDARDRESESVSNQRSLLLDYAEKQGFAVAGIYVDDGYSGTSFDRPAFQRLIGDIRAGTIDTVLTKDMSRLGRDYILTGHYLERFFPEHGVRYISLLDNVDTASGPIDDITPIKAIFNDFYARDISRKITAVKRDKQRKGLFVGGKAPYGYRLVRDETRRFAIDECAAIVVRRMFQLALQGESCRAIAVRLNSEGIPSPAAYANLTVANPGPRSGQWSAERIAAMLKNEVYIGSMVQGKQCKLGYKVGKSRRLPPEEWTIVEHTHPPLVERSAFEQVQRQIESRRRTRSRKHDHPLKGLVFCSECGHPLGVVARTLASSGSTLYFLCRSYQRFPREGLCTSHCMRVDAVARAISDQLAPIFQACARSFDFETCALQALQSRANVRDVPDIHQRIDSIEQTIDRIYADKLAGGLEEADFQRLYNKAIRERARLQSDVSEYKAPQPDEHELLQRASDLTRRFWEGAGENRALLASLIDRIEISEDKRIRIAFRFQPPDPSAARHKTDRFALGDARGIADREKGPPKAPRSL